MTLGFLTLDIIILISAFIALTILAFHSGTKLIVRSVLTFYIATYIHTNLTQLQSSNPTTHILGYILVFAITFFAIKRIIKGKRSEEGGRRFGEALLIGFAGTILLLVLNYSILPVNALYQFTIPFESLFTTTVPLGIWLIVPLILLYLTHLRPRY